MDYNSKKKKFISLKGNSGLHSPNIHSIIKEIPEIKVDVDACYLSNPYATELFLDYLKRDIINTGRINDMIGYYPSPNTEIAKPISKTLNIPSSNILVCNGAVEGIQAILNMLTGKLVIPIPTFSSYYEYCHNMLEPIYYNLAKERDYVLDLEEYAKFIHDKNINNVLIINPNNPTGSYINSSDIITFIEEHKHLDSIILDESFIHFASEDGNSNMQFNSIQGRINDFDNVFIVKSMAKDFGIAGLRCGYVLMRADHVRTCLSEGFLWNVNGIAEYFFELYGDKKFLLEYENHRKKYIADTLSFYTMLKELAGIKILPSNANFFLVEILNGSTSEDLTLKLLIEHNIYVRDCNDKIGLQGEYVRIASRTERENKMIYEALENSL